MKTIKISNPANLPTIAWEILKKDYEPNTLKRKQDRDVGNLKEAIVEMGFTIPMFIWEKGKYITDGAGRFMALELLEYEGYQIPDIPYIPLEAKSRSEAKRLTLAISSQYGVVSQDSFADFVLDMGEIKLDFININDIDLNKIDWNPEVQKEEYNIREVDVPEIPVEPKSKLGEIYQLGEHRLMCGDSTKKEDIDKLMNGKKADMVFTDPPWNVNYGAVEEGNSQVYKPRTILNDFMGTKDFKEFMISSFKSMNEASKEGAMTYVVMSAQEWGNMMLALAMNSYHWSSTIIWNKDRLVLSRKDYHTKYEPIWYGWKEGDRRLHPLKDRKQSDVWDFERPTKSEVHPTMKPIELVARAIQNSSDENNIVLDLFGGSGTTMIASEQVNRACYMMELDPKYVDVIIERWENLTFKKAKKVQ